MMRDAVLEIVLRHYLAHAKSSLGSENTTKPTAPLRVCEIVHAGGIAGWEEVR